MDENTSTRIRLSGVVAASARLLQGVADEYGQASGGPLTDEELQRLEWLATVVDEFAQVVGRG